MSEHLRRSNPLGADNSGAAVGWSGIVTVPPSALGVSATSFISGTASLLSRVRFLVVLLRGIAVVPFDTRLEELDHSEFVKPSGFQVRHVVQTTAPVSPDKDGEVDASIASNTSRPTRTL